MKNLRKYLGTFLLVFTLSAAFAQTPPPPNNNNPGNPGNNPVGGGAPVGSGVLILLSAAVAYGAKNLFRAEPPACNH